MPIPILIWAGAAAIGLFATAKNGLEAKENSDIANSICADAKERDKRAREDLERKRKEMNEHLVQLGREKFTAYASSLKNFCAIYEKIGAVDRSLFKQVDGYDEDTFKTDMQEIKQVAIQAEDVLTSAVGGALGGAALAGGAYGITGIIGVASTGTAIGTLSGAAATNATLAWLGGGAIAAGGAGVIGGMVVLGGIALAPVAIFTSWMAKAKSEEKLEEARSFREKVDAIVEKVKTLIQQLDMMSKLSVLAMSVIRNISAIVDMQNKKMSRIADKVESAPQTLELENEELKVITDTVNSALLLRKIIDTPLMDEEGKPVYQLPEILEKNNDFIHKMMIDHSKYEMSEKERASQIHDLLGKWTGAKI